MLSTFWAFRPDVETENNRRMSKVLIIYITKVENPGQNVVTPKGFSLP